ncbi:MAG TPA: sulfite exporter TauE/SafE family protein [Gemmatimonadales bacterium]|nr:sulfite exporter TauE/SafE family protein [Gemmatimonadales bacterium]
MTAILGYGLALLIGLSLGLLGGGGSILTVPVLHYVLGYDVKAAVPMSLVIVGLTSGFGATTHWRAGTVNWRAALSFAPSAIVGSVLGAELGLKVEPGLVLTIFALIVLAAAISMLLPRPAKPARETARSMLLITFIGAVVGLITGFVGVGGGFLYVPALVILGGLAVKEAIGTSLVLIMLSCIAAVARYHGSAAFDWRAIFLFSALAFVGVAIGSRLVPHVSQQALRKGFAVFLLIMGALVLLRGR